MYEAAEEQYGRVLAEAEHQAAVLVNVDTVLVVNPKIIAENHVILASLVDARTI